MLSDAFGVTGVRTLLDLDFEYVLFAALALLIALVLHLWLRRYQAAGVPLSVWIMTGLILSIGAFLAQSAGERARLQMAAMVEGYAPTYAIELARLGHADIALSAAANNPQYLAAIAAELRWLAANPGINDIYTMRKDAAGKVRFVVDSETDYDRNGRFEGEREGRTAIGEVFDNDSKALMDAFAGRGGFQGEPYTDRWGVWVSAFWPIRDAHGRVEAVLGVDYAAAAWVRAIANARRSVIGIGTIVLLLLFGATAVIALLRAQLGQREQTQLALTRAKEAAESANDLKSQFLANMSHEIRTPIHGIMGLAELQLSTEQTDKQRRWSELTLSSVRALLAVINNILDYSKIESERLIIEHIPYDAAQIVRDVLELHAAQATEKGLTLNCTIADAVPATLIGDPTRMRQVLNNLISNAIKFTGAGSVRVRLDRVQVAGRTRLRCEVIDSGPGIADEHRASLFVPFVQADGSTTRRFGGTGLGLAISKKLVELMDGCIDYAHAANGGAHFSFELPWELPPVDIIKPAVVAAA